ncbi:MAG: HYC_CC_PP family protein [Emticicia sp.]|uniref:HYC_CC_PP family protein n=1 Tax=Emticicia sp. TaxID=1930953 RepID=UPI003BA7D351
MKKALFRIFNVLMAVVVLLSSTGFGLVEHSCTVRGKQTSLRKSETACCNKTAKKENLPQKTTVKKAKCCTEEEKYENVDYSSSASQSVAKFVQNGLDWVKTTVISFIKAIVEDILNNISSKNQASSPPSSTGRAILVQNQTFLI